MAREWKVKDRFQVEVGGDAAPPAEAAAPSAKKWNAVNRFPQSYVMPVANDDAPAEMPALSDPGPRGRRISAPSPLTVPQAAKPSAPVEKPFDPWGGYYSQPHPSVAQDPDSFGAALDNRARELLVDPLTRGWRQTAQGSNVLTAGMGAESQESAAADIAARQRQLNAMPVADFRADLTRRLEALQPGLTAEEFDHNLPAGTSRQRMIDAAPPPPTGTAALANPYGAFYGQRQNMPLAQIEPGPSVPEVIWEYAKDPRNIVDVALESGSASLASILGGAGGGAAAGTVTANPLGVAAGAALGAGSGSFLIEYSNDVLDTFRKNRVDLSDENAVLAAFHNPELMAQARDHALKRGAGVALFDALSAGLAGRVAKPVEQALAKTGSVGARVAPLAGEAAEVLAQGAAGGAGEATGATFAGDKVDPVAVAQEMVGELGPGVAEILYGRAQHQAATAKEEAQAGAQRERSFADVMEAAKQYSTGEPPAPPAPPPPAPRLALPAPSPDTMAAPPVSGSPPPDSNSPKASAPIRETGQGAASPPPAAPAAAAAPAPEPLTTPTTEPVPSPAAPLAPSAPTVPEPAPVPQTQQGSTTAQKPPASGAALTSELAHQEEQRKLAEESKGKPQLRNALVSGKWTADVDTEGQDSHYVARAFGSGRDLTVRLTPTKDERLAIKRALADYELADTPEEKMAAKAAAREAARPAVDRALSENHFPVAATPATSATPPAPVHAPTATPEFKNWFGKSHVVDDKGAPLVVYHATTKDFDTFKPGGDNPKFSGPAIWAGPSKEELRSPHIGGYQGEYKEGTSLMPLYMRLENPLRVTKDNVREFEKKYGQSAFPKVITKEGVAQLKAEGYDGVIDMLEPSVPEYVAFHPNQVKSATGNSGKFSKRSPNVLKESAPTEHMAAPNETPDSAATGERGTLRESTDGYDVSEEPFDEEKFTRLFMAGQRKSESGRDARPGAATEPQRPGTTVAGQSPRAGWREAILVRQSGARSGSPRVLYHGETTALAPEHFEKAALGFATGHPSSGLGVFYTTSEEDAAKYGAVRESHLDIRNPYFIKSHALPGFDSTDEAYAFRRALEAEGYDGIVIDQKDVGGPDNIVAFHADQVIHPESIEENAPKQPRNLREQAAGRTGHAPEGEEPKGRSTPPDDPLRRIAGESAAKIRKALAADKTPPRAPKRDQVPGRSNYDTMWRDLFSSNDPNVSPESLERRDQLATRIQNAPLPRQMKLARTRLKHYFDFKDIVIDPKLSPREALDVMLDAYNNLHTMANVMGQPRQAMGFNGKLTLVLKHSLGNKGTRGMFSWNFAKGFDASTLALARQADSFAHEWIHALDLNLLMRYTKSHDLGVSGLADYTRNPLEALPPRIRDAFTNLLRAMFLVDEKSAQEMARLTMAAAAQADQLAKAEAKLKRTKEIVDAGDEREARAAKHEQEAARTKDPFIAAGLRKAADTLRTRTKQAQSEIPAQKAEVEKLAKALAETKKKTIELLSKNASKFHQGSAYVDQLTGQKYFSLPAEMLARAGESWMANRIGQQVGVEFLAGSPEFYNENADRLMALVYPDANEREGIFQRYDELAAALGEEQYFSGDTVADKIPGDTMFDKELYEAASKDTRMNIYRRFYVRQKRDFVNTMMAAKGMVSPTNAVEAAKATNKAIGDWLKSTFYSTTGTGQSLIAAYKGNPEAQHKLRQFYSLITTNPGARNEVQGQTAQEEITQLVRQKYALVDRIVETYDLDMGDLDVRKKLFEEYVRPTEQVHEQLKTHKKFLEQSLADMAGDRNKTDEAASIRRYLKRIDGILATHPLPETPTTPIQKAAVALRKIADEMYKRNIDAGIKMGYVSNHMNRVLDRDAIAEDRAGFLEQATLAYQMTNLAEHQKLQREEKRLEALVKAADAAEKRGVRPPRAIATAKKRLTEVRSEMTRVTDRNAQEQAEAYLQAIEIPDLFVPDRNTPKTKYTKERVLGPAADILLAPYYEQNPVNALKASIGTTAARVAYAKRFGVNSEKLNAMRKELVAAGVNPRDLETLDDSVKVAFGQTGNFNSAADTAANWAMSLALMKMLSKAAFNNLPEPINAASVTGRSMDGFKALAYAYLPILRGESAREHRLVMELLGLTASAANEAMVANRSGIELGDEPFLTRLRAGFGKVSLVHPLTTRGNFALSRVMMDYSNFVAESWVNGTPDQKAEAMAVFNEFGVPPNLRDDFAQFVRKMPKGRPTSQQLREAGDYEMKQLYGGVIARMVRYAMQDPQRVDRARGSFGRVGRFVFSITNFPMSYQRNIMVREAKLVAGAYRAGKSRTRGFGAATAMATKFTFFAMQLAAMSMLAGMAREWWDDRERLKKKKLEDFLSAQAALEALDRGGRTGMATSLVNYVWKFKFDRELSSVAIGAVPAFYLDDATKIAKGFGPGRDKNSPNTALDERKAWGAVYDLTIGLASQPVIIGLGMQGPTGWAASSKINSRGWKESFANAMAPPTPTEKAAAAKAAEKAERSPEEVELDQEEHDADEQDRLELLEMEYGE